MKAATIISNLEGKRSLENIFSRAIPDDLQNIIWSMNIQAGKLRKQGKVSANYYAIGKELWDDIQIAEDNRVILPSESVLEFGSGNGSALLTWAYKGYNITGIEIDPRLAQYSRNSLAQHKRMFSNSNIRIIQDSYYPAEYIEYRRSNPASQVAALEEHYLRGFGSARSRFFFLECNRDAYKENKISIADFDIIYAYMWMFQVPSVVEVFQKYAREDAKLFLITPNKTDMPTQLGLRQHPSCEHIYTKS